MVPTLTPAPATFCGRASSCFRSLLPADADAEAEAEAREEREEAALDAQHDALLLLLDATELTSALLFLMTSWPFYDKPWRFESSCSLTTTLLDSLYPLQ